MDSYDSNMLSSMAFKDFSLRAASGNRHGSPREPIIRSQGKDLREQLVGCNEGQYLQPGASATGVREVQKRQSPWGGFVGVDSWRKKI